tara:strand:- start:306 stop:428 length:123 start_codon:yes stop_codon:yes gene_type:complete
MIYCISFLEYLLSQSSYRIKKKKENKRKKGKREYDNKIKS